MLNVSEEGEKNLSHVEAKDICAEIRHADIIYAKGLSAQTANYL